MTNLLTCNHAAVSPFMLALSGDARTSEQRTLQVVLRRQFAFHVLARFSYGLAALLGGLSHQPRNFVNGETFQRVQNKSFTFQRAHLAQNRIELAHHLFRGQKLFRRGIAQVTNQNLLSWRFIGGKMPQDFVSFTYCVLWAGGIVKREVSCLGSGADQSPYGLQCQTLKPSIARQQGGPAVLMRKRAQYRFVHHFLGRDLVPSELAGRNAVLQLVLNEIF